MHELNQKKEHFPIDIIQALVDEEGVPRINLSDIGIVDPEVLNLVPAEMAQKYKFLPFAKKGDAIAVAMSNPFDIFAQKAFTEKTDFQPQVHYSPEEQIEEWIGKLYFQNSELIDDLKDESEMDIVVEEEFQDPEASIVILGDQSSNAPAIRYVNTILKQAIQERASDIHIEPQENNLKVRFRIDGILAEIATIQKKYQQGIISRIKIMSGLDIAERRVPQDGRIKIRIFGRSVDLRVSTLPTIYGEKIVMRILDKEGQSLNISDIGFEPEIEDKFLHALNQPHGLILVTGPTGSGKTTTLYSALNHVNSPDKNLITVEDPVEFRLKGINQVQAKPEVGLTFAAGLRSILRQDPDVVMVGEIRDTETAEIAIRAALTGHLVFSTLHTNNSIETIMRLIDMGIDKYLLCSSIQLIVAQRLVRRICFHCSDEYEIEGAMLERFEYDRELLEKATLYRGTGCDHCGGTGYRGRVAIFEFFYLNNTLRDVILKGANVKEIWEKAREFGMDSLLTNGLRKVCEGITTVEEVLKVTTEN